MVIAGGIFILQKNYLTFKKKWLLWLHIFKISAKPAKPATIKS